MDDYGRRSVDMSKAVMLSIRPKWCELIASGKKTIEVRKTAPKLATPFRCFIYETRGDERAGNAEYNYTIKGNGRGRVIGEFVCDEIKRVDVPFPAYREEVDMDLLNAACLTYAQAHDYRKHRSGFGWHINDLVIYDRTKELSEFFRWNEQGNDIRPCQNGKNCKYIVYDYSEDCEACAIDFDGTDCPFLKVMRPPQSWCYVEV